MKTGFLIVNYNDAVTTFRLFCNIKEYSCIEHIVVVDNDSTDDSYEMLRKLQNEHISVIQNTANNGYGSGINCGVKYLEEHTTCTSVIISNSDIEIDSEEDIERLINPNANNWGIVAPVIREHGGYNRGWKIPTAVQDSVLNIVGIHKLLRPKMLFYTEDYLKSGDMVEVEAVSGCFFLIDIKVLKEIGYFDEHVFLYYEENMIAKKLQEIEKKTYLDTTIEVFHNHSVSIDKSMKRKGKYRELKKSQRYFQEQYNQANNWELAMLSATEKLSYALLSLVWIGKR